MATTVKSKESPKKKKQQQQNKEGRQSSSSSTGGGSFVTKYFLVILFLFACLSLFLNTRFTHVLMDDVSALEQFLLDSSHSSSLQKKLTSQSAGLGDVPVQDDDQHQVEGHHNIMEQSQNEQRSTNHHSLNCDKYGGPSYESAKEMIYWKDIPNDADHISPFHSQLGKTGPESSSKQFMTFEPDQGGWNNIRMAMETVLTMAFAMGRTLVLPPHQQMYLLGKKEKGQRNEFSFEHFFHMEEISEEHIGLDIISMKEFLQDHVMPGKFIDPRTKKPMYPPQNKTDWDGSSRKELKVLYEFLRNNITSTVLLWSPEECVAAFPKSTDPKDMDDLKGLTSKIKDSKGKFPDYNKFVDNPFPVDASPEDRLKENWAERKKLCVYDEPLQQSSWIHFPMSHEGPLESRLLVHFYAFLFFQDWQQDLKMKRFVRDHVRYIDEIQCAAARVVEGIRQHALKRTNGTSSVFDSLHVRRGDFQYKVTRAEAPEIYKQTTKQIPDGTTVYIATDERNKAFFDPIKEHYDVLFLDDFLDKLEGINTNYYGMIDQLVASRGRIFFGCWFSTFTGYINRLRGYHHHYNYEGHNSNEDTMEIVPSWYYALEDRYDHMQHYWPVKKSFYAREFPTSWRLIDAGAVIPDQETA